MGNKWFKSFPVLLLLFIVLPPLLASKNGIIVLILGIIIFNIFKKIKNQPSFFKGGVSKNMSQTIDLDALGGVKNVKHKIVTILLIIFGAWLFFASIQVVEAGQTGVYSLFGRVKDNELRSGFHLVIPLAKVTRMSIRTEEYTMSIVQGEGQRYGADAITALTKEGLNVDLDMTVLYRLEEEDASDVYRDLGLNYDEKIIRPTIRTAIRDIIAQYEAKDIYSEKREEAANKIKDQLAVDLVDRGIIIEDVLLRNVVLPPNLANAIQEKLQAEQEAEKYDFILAKEEKEKERKVIEAEGRRDSQKIINESLTTNYLYFLYINELKDREGTVYVPTSPGTGMPLFRDLGR